MNNCCSISNAVIFLMLFQIEARVILVRFLSTFNFELVPDQKFSFQSEVTMKPREGCKVFITEKKFTHCLSSGCISSNCKLKLPCFNFQISYRGFSTTRYTPIRAQFCPAASFLFVIDCIHSSSQNGVPMNQQPCWRADLRQTKHMVTGSTLRSRFIRIYSIESLYERYLALLRATWINLTKT